MFSYKINFNLTSYLEKLLKYFMNSMPKIKGKLLLIVFECLIRFQHLTQFQDFFVFHDAQHKFKL